ncbi:MAG: restriction endonuclease subunit S [Candidatus Dadabacteria bacterium]|nr:restriction endonuclease subunit S [Candidatus Dadabacteria bacterium]
MSKVDKLIAELSPNGVEFKELGDTAYFTIVMGQSPDGKSVNTDENGIEFHQGKANFSREIIANSGQYTSKPTKIAEAYSVLMSVRAPVGTINYTNRKICIGRGLCAIQTTELVISKYLFYMMQILGQYLAEKSSGSTFTSTRANEVKAIKIPTPPLVIQEEIVKILDTFTELEAELEARKKQYEYYRSALLTFNDKNGGGGVERRELQEIFEIKNGYTLSKKNADYWTKGTIPWFRMDDIRKNGRILDDSIQHVTPQAVKNDYLFPANSIIIATTATIGEHALITVDSLANQQFTFLTKKVNRSVEIDMKFMFYYGYVLGEWCRNNTNAASFASVDMKKFKKFKIPIPPIAEQKRIVSILDKFEALVDDISIGLPAELAARRKQYEYYRTKLLTFSEYVS